ncbi:Beta-lactamase/transpeptidase-like protein [Metarhizium album ARSEF 1941]|uniref:Beta-lactamase/transpeptidase-like protein n=1 Tax=Metarhizium album (strain ARSEF 1941) TaxID=1081103 RepID=A0A0B2WRU5_METAS|nr:Beta-lactamase/transpeptidase-like protein [Metarhizium album ARSEF 1941]KHN95705.1 Beta-lactamase/transpeptidase-like protein [Metarhizium album ARSEF 1941]
MARRTMSRLMVAAVVSLPAALSAQMPLSHSLSGPASKSPFTGDFGRYVEGLMDEWKLAGMAVAVVDGDDVFTKVRPQPRTLMPVGPHHQADREPRPRPSGALAPRPRHNSRRPWPTSSTPSTTLKDGWSTRISSIIRDDFVLQDAHATEHLTLDDAVSHRTGLPGHHLSLATYPNSSTPVKDAVRNLRNLPIQLELRLEWHYCNPMWQVLTHVVETVTGKSLRETLERVIWAPLGMKSTFLDVDSAKASGLDLSTGYWYDGKKGRHVAMPFIATAEVSGAGAVISSVLDHAKWVKALLKGDAFLSEAVHEDVVRPRFISMTEPSRGSDVTTYALGWFRTRLHGEMTIWHSGSTSTHGALVYWLPERQYGVVVFANYPNGVMKAVTYRLIEDRLGVPQDKRIDIDGLEKEDVRKAKQDFANATALLFPDLPSPRLPPSVDMASLAGTYHHDGYGKLKLILTQQAVGEDGGRGRTLLVADRPELIFAQRVTLQHASGDYWTSLWRTRDDDPEAGQFFKARFVMGSDGEVQALEVTHRAGAHGFLDGVVSYARVR